jgi:hypothetical protein
MLPSHTLLGQRLWRPSCGCTSCFPRFCPRPARLSSLLLSSLRDCTLVNVRCRSTAIHSLLLLFCIYLFCPGRGVIAKYCPRNSPTRKDSQALINPTSPHHPAPAPAPAPAPVLLPPADNHHPQPTPSSLQQQPWPASSVASTTGCCVCSGAFPLSSCSISLHSSPPGSAMCPDPIKFLAREKSKTGPTRRRLIADGSHRAGRPRWTSP